MKFKSIALVFTLMFLSCGVEKKATDFPWAESTLKSDILLQNIADKPFVRPDSNDRLCLTPSGKSLLKATAVFKVINDRGMEIHCETFPASELMQPEYKTAHSVLKEAHLREVVEEFFQNPTADDPNFVHL